MFLEKLDEYPALPKTHLAKLDELYNLTPIKNSEIRFRWQMLCLKANYTPIFPYVISFITEQGRMKFVRPLYR
jgi:leukotriene-A4 hydrolase